MENRIKNEIEHGKYLLEHGAGEVWNWSSPAGIVRWQRRVKMLTAKLQAQHRVLELGCGTGFFTKEIVKTGASVVAIDISPELLAVARKEFTAPNVELIIENAYQTSFPDASFDSIIGSSVLHHLDTEKAFNEIYRLLKPGGCLAFTEPNMMNPQIALQKNIPWLKRKLGDSPDETAFFKWKIKRQLKKKGFKAVDVIPFDFLHPGVPQGMVSMVNKMGAIIEKTPLLRNIAGSLYIYAQKTDQ